MVEEVRNHLREMLESLDLARVPGVMPWCWYGKRMVVYIFPLTSAT